MWQTFPRLTVGVSLFWNLLSRFFLPGNAWRNGLWLAEPARRKTSMIFGAICRKQFNYTKTYIITEYGLSLLASNTLLILDLQARVVSGWIVPHVRFVFRRFGDVYRCFKNV